MTISGIGSSVDYGQIASGNKINSASDDPSGMAIANKMESQKTGLDVGAENAKAGENVLNIADSGLKGIQDYLGRIQELSLKASNKAVYSASDLSSMQKEVDQMLKGIQDIAKGTEYNQMKLLDGSMADMNIATNPDGTGMKIQMENSTLEALGIKDYNLTGNFDMSAIDKAMQKVSASRSKVGASTNALNHAYSYNTNASLQTSNAQSRIQDLDFPKAVSETKKNKLIDDYQNLMLKKKMEQEESAANLFK